MDKYKKNLLYIVLLDYSKYKLYNTQDMLRTNSSNNFLPRHEEPQSVYEIDTKFLEQVTLDYSIESLVLDGLDTSDSSAAISGIYNKLCKILCYDQEAFLSLNDGTKLKTEVDRHKDPRVISQVSLDRNEVICNDFSVIFAKLVLNTFSDASFSIRETYTGMPNSIMHISSVIDMVGAGRLEIDPLSSFTRSDFLRIRLGLSPTGLRGKNASMAPDDTYSKYYGSNLDDLGGLLKAIQEDVQLFALPAVESASFAKGALRAAVSGVDYKVIVPNYKHDNSLVSVYALVDSLGEEVSKVLLRDGMLTSF